MDIKHYILNSKEPLLFKRSLDWKIAKWDIKDWCELLGDEPLGLRKGKVEHSQEPQWESVTERLNGNIQTLLNCDSTKEWMYFDYKYLKDWFTNKPELRKEINWSKWGFPNITADESTIWIGSKGAHTPCHVDNYGFNLVAQVLGRKVWLLFPPAENLKGSRLPYEESSIYSRINFYSPGLDDYKGILSFRMVSLEPGDVLFVPNGWWHYVENVETAISINTWIPLPADNEKRIEEAITQLVFKLCSNTVDAQHFNRLLINKDELTSLRFDEALDMVYNSIDLYKSRNGEESIISNDERIIVMDKSEFTNLPILSAEELQNVLETQRKRFADNASSDQVDDIGDILSGDTMYNIIIDALSSTPVVDAIKKKILESVK